MNTIDRERIKLEIENKFLWGYVETIIPMLEKSTEYRKIRYNTPIEQSKYMTILQELRNRGMEKQMEEAIELHRRHDDQKN